MRLDSWHTIKWQPLVTFWFNWINNTLISSKITCTNVENKWLRFYRHLLGVGSCHPTHGLQTPNETFVHQNSKILGLCRQFGQINFEAFGVFSANLSAPILVLWVPCPCFSLINRYFYKKLSLYIQIPNIDFGLGFKFVPQRIRDLAIVCP